MIQLPKNSYNHFFKMIQQDLPIVPTIDSLVAWLKLTEESETLRRSLHSTIYFANKSHKQTEYAFLYLHGYASSINETFPLTQMIAKKYKANIIHKRLVRHGIELAPMEYLSPNNWYYSALQGLAIANKLGKKIIVISCSTGSTLSLLLSSRKNSHNEMKFQVLISPNTWPYPKFICKLFLSNFSRKILENVPRLPLIKTNPVPARSKHRISLALSDYHEQNCTLRAPTQAIAPMMQLVNLLWNLKYYDSKLFSIPTSVIANPKDRDVIFDMTKKFFKDYPAPLFFNEFNAPQLEHHNHVLAGNMYSPKTTAYISELILKDLDTYLETIRTTDHY